MNRRELLTAAALAALPWRRLRAEPGWRAYEVTTTVDIAGAEGTSRAWLPLPLGAETDWQRTLGNSWSGNAARAEEVRVGRYGVPMVYAEWTHRAPHLEVKSRFATQDRAVDVTRPGTAKLTSAEIALYTAPTEMIPCDGLVRETALMRIAKGARGDVEKARAIYQWIVQNTQRDPKVKGCGTGNVKAMLESGNFGGKCADLNGLFVAFCRSLGIPARDVFGLRVGRSALGYASLGPSTPVISKAQHCRAEFFADGVGWVPVDPADVRKVVLEENLPLTDAKVEAARKRLFGSWEMNWVALNYGHDLTLPRSSRGKLGFLMYPQAETADGRLDCLDPESFQYAITAREVA